MQIAREKLLTQLESVLPGLAVREAVEQSSCIIFKDNRIFTFNGEISCSQDCELGVKGAIQAMPLINILRKLKEDDLEISLEDAILNIQGQKRKTELRLEKDILLPIDTIETPTKWQKLPDDFVDAIAMVQECAGSDKIMFITTCIHMTPDFVEASDNTQIARYHLKTGLTQDILVKRESLKYITTMNITKFSETESWIHFRNPEGLTISCRKYMEAYPDCRKVLEFSGDSMALPKGLKESAERCEIFSSEIPDSNQVIVTLKEGKLKILGSGASGRHTEFKDCNYKGPPICFTISPKLLSEIVRKHNDCEVTPDKLKVTGGKFIYVTSLGVFKDKTETKKVDKPAPKTGANKNNDDIPFKGCCGLHTGTGQLQ